MIRHIVPMLRFPVLTDPLGSVVLGVPILPDNQEYRLSEGTGEASSIGFEHTAKPPNKAAHINRRERPRLI